MITSDVWAVFQQGLTITGVGMALVFGTLILVAFVIWALDKLFRVLPVATGDEADEADEAPQAAVAVAPEGVEDGTLGQVAAIAVALALQATKARPALAAAPAGGAGQAMAPLPWQAVADVDDEEITGEVVTVTGIAGSASWKARGRLDGLK